MLRPCRASLLARPCCRNCVDLAPWRCRPDETAAEHARLADTRIIQRTSLAGSNAFLAAGKFHLDAGRTAYKPSRMRRTRRPHLHEDVDAPVRRYGVKRTFADPVHVAQLHLRDAQCFTGTNDDPPVGGVEPHHIERLPGRNTETAPLADREINYAGVTAQHPPGEIDDVARRGGARPQPFDHVCITAGGHEADVLAVGLFGNR